MKTNAKLIVLVFALMCVFSAPVWSRGFVVKPGMAVTKATTHYVVTGAYNRQLNKIRQNSEICRLQRTSVPHYPVIQNSFRLNKKTTEKLNRSFVQIKTKNVGSSTRKSVKPSPAQKMIDVKLGSTSSSLNAGSLKSLPAKTARK